MDAQNPEPTTRQNVRAITRAVAILRAFTGERPSLTLGEVAAQAGLDKATTRRILLTLQEEALITQDPVSHRYALGLRILEFVGAVPAFRDLRDESAPLLAKLAEETRTNVFLSVYREGEAMCLARFQGDHPVHVNWWQVGGRLPINCGGAPRVLLAFQPQEEIERRLAGPLMRLTERSQTDPAALRRDMRVIHGRGWEFATDDVAVGLSALGVPILDRTGGCVGAVSIAGLTAHISEPETGAPRFLDETMACARRIAASVR
ncbi:MAG: IclR family transcriptional regulator [Rhodospirillales bacterium]|jgi:DNA-binding IclR family transcriptional regulator